MIERPTYLSAFLGAHCTAARALPESSVKAFFEKCHQALKEETGEVNDSDKKELPPVCEYLQAALSVAYQTSAPIKNVGHTFEAIAQKLPWQPRLDYKVQTDDFYNGHANAVIIGDGGLENHRKVRVGASLIAPNIEYPNHRHPPEEGYLVISEGEWRQEANPWLARTSGETMHNPPNIWHAMKAGNKPLLAIWMLWMETDS